ncbi:MAG: hypothetical protein J7L53_12700 [Deltaproteobacteria bacterium]|nr:hypothetical protein [Deltaproteobacteria bacterium]
MRTKRKLSVSIDKALLIEIDRAAKTLKVAKSQLAEEAFKLWLKKQTQRLMAEGYEAMAKEDRDFSELTFEAQKEIL